MASIEKWKAGRVGPEFLNVEPTYRFDGVAQRVRLEDAKRPFSNSILIDLGTYWSILYQANDDMILPSLESGKPDQFHITDSDFVMRMATDRGEATVEFSLDDPWNKEVFTGCGYQYGKPPKVKTQKQKNADN